MKALRTIFGALTTILCGGLIAEIILTVKQFNFAHSISYGGMNLVEFFQWGDAMNTAYLYRNYCYWLVALVLLTLLATLVSHMVIMYRKEMES